MVKKTSVFSLQNVAMLVDMFAAKLQAECIEVRRELFFDPVLGFNHNMGGVRTGASRKEATEKINAITNGVVEFHFISHRRLWFQIKGVDKRYIIHASNEYLFETEDSTKMNPYEKVAKELIKAAKEWGQMEELYNNLLNAA